MQHTTNYNLSQYDATDRVTRDAFNADNLAIDAALKSVSDAAGAAQSTANAASSAAGAAQSTATTAQSTAATALAAAQAAAAAGCRVVAGTYTGDGTATRTIDLGGQPKAVYVCTRSGAITGQYVHGGTTKTTYSGGLAMPDHPASLSNGTNPFITVAATGFIVYWQFPSGNYVMGTNRPDSAFYYVALL